MPSRKFHKYAILHRFAWIAMLIIFLVAVVGYVPKALADTTSNAALQSQIDANNQQISDLNKKIAEYQVQLQKVGADKKTLQAAINSLTLQRSKVETQIAVTQRQIDTTEVEIKQLGSDIASTQQTIVKSQTALAEYFRDFQKADSEPLIGQVLSAGSISDAWDDVYAISQIQVAIADKMNTLQIQKGKLSYSQSASKQKKDTLTEQKQSLTAQQQTLMATKKSKDELLAETKAQESKYQTLLSAAKAQLASFTAFAKNAGGSGLLSNQTSCDSWGCYYNQRDSKWGNSALNGTQYRLASDGCLITSMAMVMTHYGYSDVNPETINDNSNNFATYYPAYLSYTIYVDGITATRKTTSIDATLATGNPVVVGLHAYGGTHFVVLTSGKGGNYLMRDPYIANGKDISFTDHYSVKNIYEINRVWIGS